MDSVHGCGYGTIVHEIGHAIGFSPDLGNYVRINLTNMEQNKQHNLMKRNNTNVNLRGSEYDHGSVIQNICELQRLSIYPSHQLQCLHSDMVYQSGSMCAISLIPRRTRESHKISTSYHVQSTRLMCNPLLSFNLCMVGLKSLGAMPP